MSVDEVMRRVRRAIPEGVGVDPSAEAFARQLAERLVRAVEEEKKTEGEAWKSVDDVVENAVNEARTKSVPPMITRPIVEEAANKGPCYPC